MSVTLVIHIKTAEQIELVYETETAVGYFVSPHVLSTRCDRHTLLITRALDSWGRQLGQLGQFHKLSLSTVIYQPSFRINMRIILNDMDRHAVSLQ